MHPLIFSAHDFVNATSPLSRHRVYSPGRPGHPSPAPCGGRRHGTVQESHRIVGIPKSHPEAVRQSRKHPVPHRPAFFPSLFLRVGFYGYRHRPLPAAKGRKRHGCPVCPEFPVGGTERRLRMRLRQQGKFPDAHFPRVIIPVNIAGNHVKTVFLPRQGNLQFHSGVIGCLEFHPVFPLSRSCLPVESHPVPGVLRPVITSCLRTALLWHRNPYFIFSVKKFYFRLKSVYFQYHFYTPLPLPRAFQSTFPLPISGK